MKKIVYIIVSLLLVFVLTSCDIGQINIQVDADLENSNLNVGISNKDKSDKKGDEDKSDNMSEEDNSDNTNEENNSDNTNEEDNSDNTNEENNSDKTNEENNSDNTNEDNNSDKTNEENNSDNTNEDNNSDKTNEENNSDNTNEDNNSDKTNEENNSDNTNEENNSNNTNEEDQTSNEDKDTEGDQSNQNNNNNNNSDTLENVNNGVLEDASTEDMNVPINIKLLGTEDITEENNSEKVKATVVQYTLDGGVVNWVTENDLIYVITSGNNRLVVIDTKNMCAVSNAPLAGKPAEINIIDDKIYISLPDLCRIDIFSKTDCVKESSLYFDHEVSSFCLDGDYIFYSEHDQHCQVFRKNLITDELVQIGRSFYIPKLYLNKEDRILYIGESGSSGSGIYYFDADTLAKKSEFKKNDYGLSNSTREIFHVGDDIFWGNYRLSDTNAKELVGRYGTQDSGSMTFASADVVSTYEGLFLTDTYECIVNYFDAGFNFQYILVSESYNVFFRERGFGVNTILGVNFELQ